MCGVNICDSEITNNLMEHMIRLYLRVRAFSLAKDVTNKHKLSTKTKKSKSLRKSIAKATNKPDVID